MCSYCLPLKENGDAKGTSARSVVVHALGRQVHVISVNGDSQIAPGRGVLEIPRYI